MSVILYVLGGLAVMLGATLVGFGIPIKEFGIGNTLILSGTVTFCTGLLLVALATAVAHLVRLTDLLASRGPVRDARPLEPFDRLAGASAAATGAEGRIPFPPRPKPPGAPPADEARPLATPATAELQPPSHSPSQSPSLAPSLRNPDLAAADLDKDDAPVKPAAPDLPTPDLNLPPPPPLPSTFSKPAEPQMPPPPPRPAPSMRPPQSNYFDTVWPADGKAEIKPELKPDKKLNGDGEFRPVPRFEPPASEPLPADVPLPLPEPAKEEKRAAAVLKSGVVDGMAYTLYVDGSIEAELPQGTLRFASINELREHLERGGA